MGPIYRNVSNGKSTFLKAAGGKLPLDEDGFPVVTDLRSEQHTGVLLVHYMFAFFHNILADALKANCAGMSDDLIWERARQINIGSYQFQVMDGILGLFIGDGVVQGGGLSTSTNTFDSRLRPAILTEFANSCGRYAHEFTTGKQVLILISLKKNL